MKGSQGSPGLAGLKGAPGLKGQKGEPGAKGQASVSDLWVLRRVPVVRGLGVSRTRGVEVYWLPPAPPRTSSVLGLPLALSTQK